MPAEGGRSRELRNSIMRRKQLWLALALGLVLALLYAGSALAASPLDFKMELNSSEFFEPKTITISFTVTNTGSSAMPGPVKLFYPDGTQVTEFGEPVLSAGASKNWTGNWTVTKDELVAGKISFKVVYTDYTEEGELKESAVSVSKHIQYKGGEPVIEVNRTILPQVAQEGQAVSIIYEITNSGSSDVTGVTIQENAAGKDKVPVGEIKSGDTAKYTFSVTMKKKDLTSQATITYKAGGKTYTSKVDAAVIKYGKVNLTASLSKDKKGGIPGETVKLTLKLKNSGTTDFTDVTVTDENLGVVFSGQTVKAGETLTLEKDLTITETQDLLFTVRGDNGAGGEIETATDKVTIIAKDPNQDIVLEVDAVPDRNEVYQIPGGIVSFRVTVTNKSAVDVENVVVKAVDQTLYTFEKIPAGESKFFVRDTEITMPGIFQFTANVKDQLGESASFKSNQVTIELTDPPADPTPTPVVIPARPAEITVPPQLLILAEDENNLDALDDYAMEDDGNADPKDKERLSAIIRAYRAHEDEDKLKDIDEIANRAKWILIAVASVLFVLLLIGAVRKIALKSQSAKALDHLEGGSYRNYSAMPKSRKRNEIASGSSEGKPEPRPAAQPAEKPAQNPDVMAETLQRLHERRSRENAGGGQAPVMPAAPAVPEAPEPVREYAERTEAGMEKPPQAIQTASEAAHRRRVRK